MTTWQWQVIMALVRLYLRQRKVDFQSLWNISESEDESILIEAYIRSEAEK